MTGSGVFPGPSPADLILCDAERRAEHPDAMSTIGVLLHLTGTVPDLAELCDHVVSRLPGLPCLTHVLSSDGTTAQWLPATPDMERHICAVRVDNKPQSLDAAVRGLLREPLPQGAPAWRMILLHGHVTDGFALLYLAHHAVQDGANLAAVTESLFGPSLLPEQSAVVARGVPHTPRPRLGQVVRSTATLLRHFRKQTLWTSPSQPLSSRRHTLWTHVPSSWLRTAARTGKASTNDVYLTALAHAIAEWADSGWPRAADVAIPVMVPVNLRTADEVAAPGNRLFLTRVALPGGSMPLSRRLASTRAATVALKSAEHKAVLRAALARPPLWAFERLVAMSTDPGRLTVCASSFVLRHRLGYGDAVVERVDPIICCPPGVPAAVVMCVYEDVASACFRIDEALPGAESLPARWRQALEEMTIPSQ
ncbi:wax ester/triacylglycerol synthase domain-containing protein [Streptomyces sp. NPDC048417]|uniref:wax ester/triacylglycerol synthase domain-containing protein n=1 Tax=Streptomyces sp. NPDC048417 TaxID=3155387 RepID=UPI0034397492